MKLLIDTNVLLDMILCRRNYQSSCTLFDLMRNISAKGYISASSATDLFYIIKRETHSIELTYKLLSAIFKLVHVLPVTTSDIFEAFSLKWADFEDCVQYAVAKNNSLDCIITNNTSDFTMSTLTVLTPDDFVNKYLMQ